MLGIVAVLGLFRDANGNPACDVLLKSSVVAAQELCFLRSDDETDNLISVPWLHPEAPGYLAGVAVDSLESETLEVYVNATVDAE